MKKKKKISMLYHRYLKIIMFVLNQFYGPSGRISKIIKRGNKKIVEFALPFWGWQIAKSLQEWTVELADNDFCIVRYQIFS